MYINDQHFLCFLSIAETLDYSITAKELALTPRSVMNNISSLENELGVKLLDDQGHHLHLSSAGKLFFDYFCKLEKDLGTASQLTGSSQKNNTLTVAYCDWIDCPDYLLNALRLFQSEFPMINIRLRCDSAFKNFELLQSGEVDAVLSSHFSAQSSKTPFVSRIIDEAPLYFAVSKHLQAITAPSNLSFLSHTACLTTVLEQEDREDVICRIRRLYRSIGISPIAVNFLPNWNSVYTEVYMGNGLTIVPAYNHIFKLKNFNFIPVKQNVTITFNRSYKTPNKYIPIFEKILIQQMEARK